MSIYATGAVICVENPDDGGWLEGAWDEITFQHVPNHINEQNGYGGPGWDEWLPAFKHKRGCQMRKTVYWCRQTETPVFVQVCSEGDVGAEPDPYYDCDCGDRAVFVIDDRTKKGTERCGQEYVNPVLVLTGQEYERAKWSDLLARIEDSMAERRPKVLCLEPACTGEAVHTVRRKGKNTEAWCEQHDTPKLWRGQKRRRRVAGCARLDVPPTRTDGAV